MLRYPAITKEGLKKVISPYKKVINTINIDNCRNNINNYKNSLFQSLKNRIPKNEEKDNLKLTKDISFLQLVNSSDIKSGVIKLDSVSKSFGTNKVIDNISLTIPKGKILGLVGISGSGKTTLLKMIVGFYKPTNGSVLLDGKDITKHKLSVRKNFGFGSQENCFYGRLSVQENVKYFAELYGLSDELIAFRINNVLNLVGLYEARKTLAENLSTGMKRRLDLACSLIHDPNIVILDEPTEDLDLNLRKEIISLIRKVNNQGKTIIMTSHLLSEIENICHNVCILSNGKVAKFGSPDEIKKEYSKDYEVYFQTNLKKYNSILKGLKVKKLIKKGHGVLLYVSDGEKVVNTLIKKAKRNKDKIISLKLGRPSLSEIFGSYTKNDKK